MNEGDAILKVRAVLAPHLPDERDVESLEFDVTEFSGGWLIFARASGQPVPPRGASPYTVDRHDGSVRRFSSGFPPLRIMESYDDLKAQRPALE